MTKWLVMLILVAAWALPIADQLINSPGNIRRVAHFFLYEAAPRPLLAVSVKAFAAMTAGVFQPSLYLAQGWLFEPASWWPVVALVAGVPALAVAARTEWQQGDRFTAALGVCCLVVMGAGLLSAISVRGRIGDYQLFWLTVVGAMSAAVVTTAVAQGSSRYHQPSLRMRARPCVRECSTRLTRRSSRERTLNRRASAKRSSA